MRTWIAQRVAAVLPMVLGISVVAFLLMKLIPGDPSSFLLGPYAGPDARAALLKTLGWDQPWPVQYARWISNFVHGDFGTSVRYAVPVSQIFWEYARNSAILVALSFSFAAVVGFSAGVLVAINRYSLLDRATTTLAVALASAPPYWLGLIGVWLFSLTLGLLPVSGISAIGQEGDVLDLLRHAVLPGLTAALIPMALIFRVTRSEMGSAMDQPYVQAARARGLSERSVILRHALRNVVAPVANVIGLQLGFLFTATIFSEVVFSWPGLGFLIFNAIGARDIPVIQTVVLFVGLLFVAINLAIDVFQAFMDPRSRVASNG